MAQVTSSVTIAELPEETLQKIFSHLTTEEKLELLVYPDPVCRHWSIVSQDPRLWKVIDYCQLGDISRFPMPVLIDVVSKASKLRELSLNAAVDMDEILTAVASHCPELQVLKLYEYSGTQSENNAMKNLANHCQKVCEIHMESMHMEERPLYACLAPFKNLRKLTLYGFRCLDQEVLRSIARDHCQHLEDIDLHYVQQVSDEDLKIIIEARKVELTRFVLCGWHLSDAVYLTLPKCSRLKSLNIHGAEYLTSMGLLKGVAKLSELRQLCVTNAIRLTSDAMACFLESAEWAEHVLHLDFSGCNAVDDLCLEKIAMRCPLLRSLSLRACKKITDQGLAHVIKGCRHLHQLNLPEVKKVYGSCFDLIPTHLPQLQLLNLELGCSMDPAGLLKLLVQMPRLVIKDFAGSKVKADADGKRIVRVHDTLVALQNMSMHNF